MVSMSNKVAPIKVSNEMRTKLRLLAAITGKTQGHLAEEAINLYAKQHLSEIARAIRVAHRTLGDRTLLDDLRSSKAELVAEARKGGLSNIRIFGSVARGTSTASSDLDILVDANRPISLIDLLKFSDYVAETLGVDVDVFTERTLNPSVRESVLAEAIKL